VRHLRQRRTRHAGWMAGPLAALVVVMVSILSGCGASVATGGASQSHKNTPETTVASMAPTVTSTAARSGQCQAQGLPQGWTWYQDARYPFRVAAPPVWHAGAFEYIPDGSGALSSPSRIHVVDFFGPGSAGQARSSGEMRSDTFPPVITIEVSVGSGARPPDFGSGQLANWHAQSTPVCIGQTPVTLYVFSNSEGDVERAAVLRAGPQGYACTFTVASHAGTAARDGQFFMTMLATFGSSTGG
jgi:hypothetical protein